MALDDPGPDTADAETLPCGADLATVWEEDRAAPGHGDCPDCAGALDARRSLEATVRAALDEDRRPGNEPAFLERLMAAVQTELRPGPLVPLDPVGDDWVTGSAAAAVLRGAVDALPGVCAGSCRIVPLAEPQPRGTAAFARRLPLGPLLAVVEVFADLSRPLPDTADLVRSAVTDAATERLGLTLSRIDVTVRDLLAEPEEL
ncbi:hypothetical protein ACIRBX_36425 [Kitasatospora sp. NPDC096147]|uniref:hypothetical protein n=1 Tax=Kitasatospora sp. NPDC096147 TaxID=3364093 RepID=UPI003803DF2A